MNDVEGILKFNLDTEEGRDAHIRACKSDKAYRALHDIDNYLRTLERYTIPNCQSIEFNLNDYNSVEVTHENRELIYDFVFGLRRYLSGIVVDSGIDLDAEYK